MKVFKDGKEVKDARVIFGGMSGKPSKVQEKGRIYSANLYTFEDEETTKQTKPATRKKTTKDPNAEIMSTADTKRSLKDRLLRKK